MNTDDKQVRSTAIEQFVMSIKDRTALFRSCISCEFWQGPRAANRHGEQGKPEHCRKYNQRPPAYYIANGCDAYLDHDEIPF